jgi:hypothetical protein
MRSPTATRRTSKALDQAYADAMESAQARFPNDPDVALLTADALMNLSPLGLLGRWRAEQAARRQLELASVSAQNVLQ